MPYAKLQRVASLATIKSRLRRLVLAANPHWLFNGLVAAALLGLAFGWGLSIGEAKANVVINRQAARQVTAANKGISRVVPSTVKPTATALNTYTVAPNLPKYLTIPKLGVNARVLSVGTTADGTVATPSNVYDTAWYNGSALPGQPGAMLIDGHISSWTTKGVFYGLSSLRPGDVIQLEQGDGTKFSYQVAKIQTYDADNVDMNAALSPIDPTRPGLNLISCTGSVLAGTSDFNQRVVVFTVQN